MYGVAFLVLLASAYALYKGNIGPSLRLVWTSLGLSGLAIVIAAASVLLPGSKPKEGTAPTPVAERFEPEG